jgi:hypothetical protein
MLVGRNSEACGRTAGLDGRLILGAANFRGREIEEEVARR